MLSALTTAMIPVSATTPVSGSIVSNTEWSGDVLLTGDVYIEHGVTLNLKAGAVVNAAEYSLVVNGTLTGTDAQILSTTSSEDGNHTSTVGMWLGVVINVGGDTSLTRVSISNAKTAIMIHGTGVLDSVSVSTSYLGVEVDGSATIDDLTCSAIDFECVLVSGSAVLDGLDADVVASGVVSSGDLDATNIEIENAGTGITISGGSGDYSNINIVDANTAIHVRGVTTATVDDVSVSETNLALDAGDSDGFVLSNVSADISRAIRGEGLNTLTVKDSSFNGSRDGTSMVDVNSEGTFTMSNVALKNASTALDLRGSGTHILTSLDAEAEDLVLSATGTGLISVVEMTGSAENQGIRISGPTFDAESVNITGGLDTTLGLRIATGTHEINEFTFSRGYSAADTTSLGVELVWATVECGIMEIEDFANGIRADSSSMSCEDVRMNYGRNNGVELDDSSLLISGTMSTTLFDVGAMLEDDSTLHVNSWNTNLHDDVLDIASDCSATVRFMEFGNTAGFDAIGDGTLVWGSNNTPVLAVSTDYQLTETMIKTVDLSGDPLPAELVVEGFSFTSGAPGLVTVPLRNTGSLVVATSGSAGAQATLIGGVSNQELALPNIPDGDWTITSGNHVVLGPSMDGQGHQLSGNLTIETGASLTLQRSSLLMETGKNFSTEGTGKLIGEGGVLSGGVVNVDTQAPYDGQGDGLTIDSNVFWNCSSPPNLTAVFFAAELTLGDECDVILTSGSISSEPILGTGATLLMRSVLSITVLDKGDPVEGAILTIGGESFSSDADGTATYTTDARDITEAGTTWGGSITVVMQSSGLMDMMMWDTNSSLLKTFLASTVESGIQNDWVILESAWSPYYLADDLTISETATLTLHDNAQLVVANDVAIILEGTITAGAGTIQSSGASPWAGITMEGVQAKLNLASTHLVGALLPVAVNGGVVVSEGAEIASGTDGLVSATYASSAISISLTDTDLRYGGQNCIRVVGTGVELNIQDSTLAECGDHALWATSATLDIDGLNIDGGSQAGVELADVEGSIFNLNAASHNGTNSSFELSQQDEKLSMRNLILTPASRHWPCISDMSDLIVFSAINDGFANCLDGSDEVKTNSSTGDEISMFNCGSGQEVYISQVNDGVLDCLNGNDEKLGNTDAAFVAIQSRWIDVIGLVVTGAPALEISYSAGELSELNLSGENVGTAVDVEHNRGSAALTIIDSQITGYSVGLSLHGHAGDEFNNPVESIGNIINCTTAIASDSLPFVSMGDVLMGAIEMDSTNAVEGELVNTDFTSITATGNATVIAWEDFSITMMMFGTGIDASASIDVSTNWLFSDGREIIFSFSNQGSQWDVVLPIYVAGPEGSGTTHSAVLSASGPGSLPLSADIDMTSGSARTLTFNLTGNTAPSSHISSPDEGQKFSVLSNVTFVGIASDGQSEASSLTHHWEVQDSIGDVIWNSADVSPTWEDLEFGEFLVRYTVSDEHGLSSTVSVSFQVSYHDSDGDWTATCDEEFWFDSTTGNKCGHDSVDTDDDNDGIIDTLDIWPLDPCADADVDNDLLPDVIDCPSGVTTELVEDGDVKKISLKSTTAEEGADMGMMVAFLLLIVGVLLVINRMRAAE